MMSGSAFAVYIFLLLEEWVTSNLLLVSVCLAISFPLFPTNPALPAYK
jgi:hypothetical protein